MSLKNILNNLSHEIGQIARSLLKIINEYKSELFLLSIGILVLIFAFPSLAELKTMLIVILIEAFCLWLIYRSAIILQSIIPNMNNGNMALGVHLSVGMIVLGVYFMQ